MYISNLPINEWGELHYKVRVRSAPTPPATPQCLWGSAGLLKDITFSTPLTLHISNDPFGEPVTFGTQVISGPPPSPPTLTTIGTLLPGECISIPLQGYSGVFAFAAPPALESTVYCSIRGSA